MSGGGDAGADVAGGRVTGWKETRFLEFTRSYGDVIHARIYAEYGSWHFNVAAYRRSALTGSPTPEAAQAACDAYVARQCRAVLAALGESRP